MYTYMCMYIDIYLHVSIYVYIDIYIYREREKRTSRTRRSVRVDCTWLVVTRSSLFNTCIRGNSHLTPQKGDKHRLQQKRIRPTTTKRDVDHETTFRRNVIFWYFDLCPGVKGEATLISYTARIQYIHSRNTIHTEQEKSSYTIHIEQESQYHRAKTNTFMTPWFSSYTKVYSVIHDSGSVPA